MATAPYVTGVVLAGGSSVRFGAPKAHLQFKGERLLDRIAAVLAEISDEVLVVGRPPLPELLPNVPRAHAIADRIPGAGPLMGLATALDYCRPGALVLVACDMPLLSRGLLAHQLALLPDHHAVVPIADGRMQPLHAVYRTDVDSTVERLLVDGESSLQALIGAINVRSVAPAEWRPFSPGGHSFFSVNTLEDLRRAESFL